MYYVDFPDDKYIFKQKLAGFTDEIEVFDDYVKIKSFNNFKLRLHNTYDGSVKNIQAFDLFKATENNYGFIGKKNYIPVVNVMSKYSFTSSTNDCNKVMLIVRMNSICSNWYVLQDDRNYIEPCSSLEYRMKICNNGFASLGLDTYLPRYSDSVWFNDKSLRIDKSYKMIYLSSCGKYTCFLKSNGVLIMYHEDKIVNEENIGIKCDLALSRFQVNFIDKLIKFYKCAIIDFINRSVGFDICSM